MNEQLKTLAETAAAHRRELWGESWVWPDNTLVLGVSSAPTMETTLEEGGFAPSIALVLRVPLDAPRLDVGAIVTRGRDGNRYRVASHSASVPCGEMVYRLSNL